MSNKSVLGNPFRLIARLDVKGENLIKGVHLEGLKVLGDPGKFAAQYYEQGADEIIYMDLVASLYGRSKLTKIVSETAYNVFVPLTVGGGVRSVDDVRELLAAGADKVAINTGVVNCPKLISDVAKKFGSQCMVLSIEAKNTGKREWEVYTDCGREKRGIKVVDWVREAISLGVGEILLTSIDQEGTRKGFDIELVDSVMSIASVPVIASGGYGEAEHLRQIIGTGVNAVAFADSIHYGRANFSDLRLIALEAGANVRCF